MNLHKIVIPPLVTNCYILSCEETAAAIVIDPGAEAESILGYIESNQLNLKFIVATHGHVDHVGAVG
ncbi:MAG: MBL fold metallo-hydrolase, partial [bacterium]